MIKILTTAALLTITQSAAAWELHTFNSRKTLDVIIGISTPQQCEAMAKDQWDEYKRIYSSWERDHMQFNTWCTAHTAKKCYKWTIHCPNVVCTTDKVEGRCL